ncbi:MAG: sarcosine oxidase subunit alpha family protein [Celeribacter sp.]|jgi:sarcosine oxidase subunit alpha
MSGPFRHASRGRVDRSTRVSFTFDGAEITGHPGDTVASALLAHGVHLVGRSFKYHRPRGILTAGSEEPNALIRTSRTGDGARVEPNTRATMQELRAGLVCESQNRWPSLRHDVGEVNDRLHPLLSTGFYYKTFMWPKSFWDRVYEPLIRASAGLGRAPTQADPDSYASRFHHCDLLVVGAGPAGLMAAREAARAGLEVTLVDESAEPGGALLSEPHLQIEGQPAWDWLATTLAELRDLGVRVMSRTTAIGYYHQNMIGLCQRLSDHLGSAPADLPRERLWRVRAAQVVLAQGALEQPMVFNGNDRPGILLAGAAQVYLNRYGVLPGRRVVVVTSHDSAWHTAFDLADAGVEIAAIADTRAIPPEPLMAEAGQRGIHVLPGHVPVSTKGRLRVTEVHIAPWDGEDLTGDAQGVTCDCVLMSGGWAPSLHLFSHTRNTLRWDEATATYLPDTTLEAARVAGAGRGLWGISAALEDGAQAGAHAAQAFGHEATAMAVQTTGDRSGGGTPLRDLPGVTRGRAFVDFQNDVTAKDLRQAVSEGMRSIEHVKRYTTNGMATDQGKMSNINGLRIASDALGQDATRVGLTTFRPPYTPTTFGAFTGYRRGALFHATRKTPIDPWACAHGAVFEPVAQWRRARYFPQGEEDMHAAVARECRTTRAGAGMFDASTLGKIEVTGPDALIFLDRLYTNPLTKLAVGRCRYALLLGEDGYIRDDGIIARIDEARCHVTTTTGGAARVLAMMEDYLQTEWPDLRVWLTSVTEEWATIAINGPAARELIAPFVEGLDLTPDAFPHMAVGTCRFDGVPCRLMRVSFTGEPGFELNIPARHAQQVWEALHRAGAKADAPFCVYGTETMHVLRAEKGYIIVGQDTDGTVTPHDAGLSWAVGRKKADFIGKRSLSREDMASAGRKHLVGLVVLDEGPVLEEGAQIVLDPDQPVPMKMEGHVTSAYDSAALGRPIALALLANGRHMMGREVYLPMPDGVRRARVTGTVWVDPANERLSR